MKEQIKQWLKKNNRTREWLGSQVGVSKKAVDNWLSSPKAIPLGKLNLIQRLIQDDEVAEAARRQQFTPTAQVFSVEVDLPTFRAYSSAALAAGLTLEQWTIDELNAAAEAAMQQSKPEASSVIGADSAAA